MTAIQTAQRRPIEPIDPASPGGRAAAAALGQALAEVYAAIARRRAARSLGRAA